MSAPAKTVEAPALPGMNQLNTRSGVAADAAGILDIACGFEPATKKAG